MGYTTNFNGKLKLNRQMSLVDYHWLADFVAQRHEGETAIKQNVPGIWCQWISTEDGKYIQWDGGEKFYNYVEWLQWLVVNFFRPKGYILNGRIKWEGEDSSDKGIITVVNNTILSEEMAMLSKCPHCGKVIDRIEL